MKIFGVIVAAFEVVVGCVLVFDGCAVEAGMYAFIAAIVTMVVTQK